MVSILVSVFCRANNILFFYFHPATAAIYSTRSLYTVQPS